VELEAREVAKQYVHKKEAWCAHIGALEKQVTTVTMMVTVVREYDGTDERQRVL
jgi:hypothetical protein